MSVQAFSEMFVVATWEEHEHQHARVERADQQLLAQIDSLLVPGMAGWGIMPLGVKPAPRRHRRS